MFNALKYTKQLEQVGLTREQAEAQVQMVIEVMDSTFATKADFNELKANFTALESKMDSGFSKLESQMAKLEYNILVKLGLLLTTIMTVGISALGLITYFH